LDAVCSDVFVEEFVLVRVLLTGATSFTGMWFAETLAREEHEVIHVNTDIVIDVECHWDEPAAWDELANYYARRLAIRHR
jgi:nucleoside-diphosphate-sugar epimerase